MKYEFVDYENFESLGYTVEEINKIFKNMCDKELVYYLGIDDCDINDMHNTLNLDISRNYKVYVIKYDNAIIGFIYLYNCNTTYKRASLGIGIGSKYRGKNHGYNILMEFTPFVFKELDLIRLSAEVEPQNIASIKLFEKLGYKYEGTLRSNYGDEVDSLIYSVLYTEIGE